MNDERDPTGDSGRLSQISTRWTLLKGAPGGAFDHLCMRYSKALLGYLRGRLARGDFRPLRPEDAEDILHDFLLLLQRNEWFRKPDPALGRFRPFLVQRLVFYLRERRAAARRRARVEALPAEDLEDAAPPSPDPLDAVLESEWRRVKVEECILRIGARSETAERVLRADMARDRETDAALAERLGMTTTAFKSALKRARADFRELFPRIDAFPGSAEPGGA